MCCSLRSSYLSLCQHISSHVCLSVPLLPLQVRLPSHPLFNALCVLQIMKFPSPRHHSFRFSTRPVSDDERRHSPATLISVIFIPSARLCLAMYLQYVCLPLHPALLCRVSCLSQLSAHTGDLLLFLEQRMKKSQSDRKYARMKTFKILLIPVLLTFCPSFTPCASYLWFPAFVFLSSVISCPLTNALRWCIFVVCPCKNVKGGHKLIDNYTYSSTSFDFLYHLHQSLSRRRSLSLDPGCELSGGFQLCSGRPDLPGVHG